MIKSLILKFGSILKYVILALMYRLPKFMHELICKLTGYAIAAINLIDDDEQRTLGYVVVKYNDFKYEGDL